MTQEELQALCAEWRRLRLQDWDIVVRVKRQFDMARADAAGHCSCVVALKEAVISILDVVDWDPDIIKPQDQEMYLVHELLHVHFSQMHDEYNSPVHVEQAIQKIAEALVALKREAARKDD